jgi:NitT/TauT family transport system substrate-binding protein
VSFRSGNRYYYSDAGLDVEFLAGKGGVDAGRQVGTGKADFAEVFGDTTIILRSEGVPIRMVALMGGRGPMVLATQAGSGVKNLKDLKGKSISILGYQDSTYYVLLAALASVNLSKEDVSIQALGPSGVIQEFIKGNVQVCACIPDWIVTAEDASVEMDLMPVSDYVPALGQSIITSDRFLAEHPDVVRRFVRATLKAYVELRDDPVEMTKVYVQAVPVHQGQDAMLRRVYNYYSKFVWSDQRIAGMVDSDRLKHLQGIYYDRHIVAKKSPIDDLYTNRFIGAGAKGGLW